MKKIKHKSNNRFLKKDNPATIGYQLRKIFEGLDFKNKSNRENNE